jgi:hypothetical protein
MALNTNTPDNVLYTPDPAPFSGQVEGVIAWCWREFAKLAGFLRRPQFPGIILMRIESVNYAEFKPQDGMLIYAGPGVLGPQEGLYIRESGAWKKIAGT